jgi:hypothetical protein
MQRLKVIGLALVAVFAMAAVAAASASAKEFVASKTGKLTGVAVNTHVFKTKAGNVECKKAEVVNSEVKALKSATQEVELHYTECKAFGFASAEVSNAKYLFSSAETKNASLKNVVTVKASTCTVTVENVLANQEREKVTYVNGLAGKLGKLEVQAKVENVTYKTGTGCLNGGKTFTDGVYEGNEEVGVEGGTLKWE